MLQLVSNIRQKLGTCIKHVISENGRVEIRISTTALKNFNLNNINPKVYGLTQNTATNEFMTVFDEFGFIRKLANRKCANCN
ncbi:hypothetical protein C2G38_2231296 [Gigaspora rosea]|uniref:Uncharacterized protein n=1 Tax=Gigaspora rosea TaxID=44941 RepID=A0A397TX06_9GLOM|nr:hypothetical protein C2G38_2231296 [Gigaspora rosea]